MNWLSGAFHKWWPQNVSMKERLVLQNGGFSAPYCSLWLVFTLLQSVACVHLTAIRCLSGPYCSTEACLNNNSNNNNRPQMGCHPVAVVTVHVYKYVLLASTKRTAKWLASVADWKHKVLRFWNRNYCRNYWNTPSATSVGIYRYCNMPSGTSIWICHYWNIPSVT